VGRWRRGQVRGSGALTSVGLKLGRCGGRIGDAMIVAKGGRGCSEPHQQMTILHPGVILGKCWGKGKIESIIIGSIRKDLDFLADSIPILKFVNYFFQDGFITN